MSDHNLGADETVAGSNSASTPDPRIQRELVATLYATIVSANAADLAIAIAIALFFYFSLDNWLALAWAGLHLAQGLRLPVLTAWHKAKNVGENCGHWERLYGREVAITSTVWGLLPWFILPNENVPMTALLMLIMLGLCSAAVPSVAPSKRAIFGYCVPMVAGLASALAWHGGLAHAFMAFSCMVYLTITLRFAFQQHALLTKSLAVRFEKEALVDQLAQQMAVVERANQERTRFFAAASHDLRQPVHAIALFGAVLDTALQGKPEHLHAQRLMLAVDALGTSLDTLLDISQLDAGVVKPHIQTTALTPLFQSLNNLMAPRAETKGLQLRLRATPLAVRSDPTLLLRMLSNLVENAIKYTPQGGVLVVARHKGGQVWIDVCDTGTGIAPEHQAHIFEEFYQGGNPGRDRSQGLGIGLSIVKRLSGLLNHPVQVASRPGRGSRFRVVAPAILQRKDRPAMPLLPKPTARSAAIDIALNALPRRVLLIDDELAIGDAMTALLGAYGVALQVATDEASAVAAFEQAAQQNLSFDALLSDYRLAAGANGLDIALNLRKRFQPDLPLLLVTGETAPERLQRVHDSGVPVLFKPVGAQDLLDALKNLIK